MWRFIWLVLILANFGALVYNVVTEQDYLLNGIAILALLTVRAKEED